jgi:hypothetical protein
MIKKVRVDYNCKHAPGSLAMVCGANGYILFDPNKRGPAARQIAARPKANKNVHPDYNGRAGKSQ